MGKGRAKENEIVSGVWDATDGAVMAWPMGYSGNNAVPSGDILTLGSDGARITELKISSGDYVSIGFDELEQLDEIDSPLSRAQLLVSFSYREPVLVTRDDNWRDLFPDCFDPRYTDTGLRLTRPELDDWTSAQAGLSEAELLAVQHSQRQFRLDASSSTA